MDANLQLSFESLYSLAPFHLGGKITLSSPVSLFFTKPDGSAGHLKFPNSTSTFPSSNPEFQALLDSCKPATFGKGATEVLDPDYRQALCLAPEEFAINIPLPSAEMLHDIQQLLQPAAHSISAQLYKLNIYGPGGFFKSHVDTPRGQGMFGSLVVCLPTDFTGGGLVLKKRGEQQYTHEWGGKQQVNAQDAVSALQWAAFYSDVEHEILPVTEGYRVTLTYNLFSVPKEPADNTTGRCLLSTDQLPASTFGQQLSANLANDKWYPSGTTLGFALDHLYAEIYEEVTIKPYMLKGSDMLLYQTIVQLGLKARIVPAMEATIGRDWDRREAVLVGDSFEKVLETPLDWYCWQNDESQDEEEFLGEVFAVKHDEDIVWVRQPHGDHCMYKAKTAAYGNEPQVKAWYVAAVLLVEVPESPRVCHADDTTTSKRQRSS